MFNLKTQLLCHLERFIDQKVKISRGLFRYYLSLRFSEVLFSISEIFLSRV